MISTIKKPVQTPLEAEYMELRKASSGIRIPGESAAQRKNPPVHHPVEDIVTLSSRESSMETPPVKTKPSLPVTPAERSALLSGFSVYG